MATLEYKLKSGRKGFHTKLLLSVVAGSLLMTMLSVAFFVNSVSFRVEPSQAANDLSVLVSDGIGVVLLNTAYVLGSQTVLVFQSPSFISRQLEVDFKDAQHELVVRMQAAAVKVVITTEPPLAGTIWKIDGQYVATGVQFVQELKPGPAEITIDNTLYHVESVPLEVKIGVPSKHHIYLTSVAGIIDIRSEPAGARVVMDGSEKGKTPLAISNLAGGLHHLELMLEGYQLIEEEISVTSQSFQHLRDYRFQRIQSELHVDLSPAGGELLINGVMARLTSPLWLEVGQKHILQYKKVGYLSQTREVLLTTNEQTRISFQLKEEIGEVEIRSRPSADIFINGKAVGVTPKTLRLQGVPQNLILKSPGYRAVELSVTPSSVLPLLIDETLKSELAARLAEAKPEFTATTGVQMKFFNPRVQANHRFTMGTRLGDKFRQANEFVREVDLTKSFYVSIAEINEQQFAAYKKTQAAASKDPVRNVSWIDAVGFCNWMSRQSGLRPAYRISNGRLLDFDPTSDGYRLLSEAEWEWLARVVGRAQKTRFMWGNEPSIPKNSGNFADESVKGKMPKYISRYRDGFVGVAPVKSFTADAAGLYDMAGNVSEWVHDVYDLQPPVAGQVAVNPFGGQGLDVSGNDARVIKGASFRSASTTQLRTAFREGLSHGRDDVGFRIARYLYGKEE